MIIETPDDRGQSPCLAWRHQPYHIQHSQTSYYSSRWRNANNMLQDFIIIGQSNIPISTAAPTHYVRFYTHTHLKFIFSKIFRALFPAPGAVVLHFRVLLLTLLIPIFFPNFRPFFTLPSSRYPPPDDRYSLHLTSTPLAGDTYLQHHPYTFICFKMAESFYHRRRAINYTNFHGGTYTPRTYFQHISYFFQKTIIKKFFGPFRRASGDHDPHFRIPIFTLHTLKFFPNSPPQLSLHGSGGYLPPTSPLHQNLLSHLRIIVHIPQSLRPSPFTHFS